MSRIGTVKETSSGIEVYDENGNYKWSRSCDALVGFTSSTVTIKNGSYNEVYDEDGIYKFSK